jgi:hypothetical protein
VDAGALIVVVDIPGGATLDEESIELRLDGNVVDVEPKVSATSIRYLIRDRLSAGRHDLAINARTVDGRPLATLEWFFRTLGDPSLVRSATLPDKSFRGTTYIVTRNASFTGNRVLRQEPGATYVIRSDMTGKYGVFTFPVRAYLTTDETSTAQPRNRVLVGVESPWFSAYGGDTQPDYSPITLAGARARGILAEVHFPGVRLSFTRGTLRRAVDLISFSDPSQVASPFLNTFKRGLTAAQLAFGNRKTVEFRLHALKATDDTTSLSFGTRPIENVVAGTDLSVRALRGDLTFESGAALSLTTEDISRGVSDKAELDSLFEIDLPIDPADYDWLITLNPSTVPLRIDKLSSLAWYTTARANAFGHRVSLEYRSIGSAFFSAGNPFLVNDRRSVAITDRFRILADRLSGTLRFLHYETQPDALALAIPLTSSMISSSFTIRPNPDLPTFTTGFRHNSRKRGDEISLLSNSRLFSISLGALHQFKSGTQTHTVQLMASRTDRSDRVNDQLDNVTTTVSAGLYEQLSTTVSANLQLTYVSIAYDSFDDRQNWTTVAGGFSKRLQSVPLRFSGQVRVAHAGASTLLTASNRFGGSVTGSYDLQQNMTLELQIGVDSFRDETIESARYTERFVSLRHRYKF